MDGLGLIDYILIFPFLLCPPLCQFPNNDKREIIENGSCPDLLENGGTFSGMNCRKICRILQMAKRDFFLPAPTGGSRPILMILSMPLWKKFRKKHPYCLRVWVYASSVQHKLNLMTLDRSLFFCKYHLCNLFTGYLTWKYLLPAV